MFRSSLDPLIVEVGDRRLRAIRTGVVKGRREILGAYETEAHSATDESARQSFKKLLSAVDPCPTQVLLVLPRHLALIKFQRLPATETAEVESIAKMMILRQLPYGEHEILAGFKALRKEAQGYTSVMLASVLKKTVDRWLTIAQDCGVVVDKVVLSIEGLERWLIQTRPDFKELNIFFVSFGLDSMDILALEHGVLSFTRGLVINAGMFEQGAWRSEITTSLADYEKNTSEKIHEIVVAAPAEMVGALRSLADEIKIPFYVFEGAAALPLNIREKIKNEPAYYSLCGLSLELGKGSIDLSPTLLREKNDRRRHHGTFQVFILLTALAAGLLFLNQALESRRRQHFGMLLDEAIKKSSAQAGEVKQMKRALGETANTHTTKMFAVEALSEIYRVTPAGIVLDALEYTDHEQLMLRGSAPGLAQVVSYAKIIEQSSLFKNARVQYAAKQSDGARGNVLFEIITAMR